MDSDGTHRCCWHLISQWTDSIGTHRTHRCCYCGQMRQETDPPTFAGERTVWTDAKDRHGPYAPDSGPTFTASNG